MKALSSSLPTPRQRRLFLWLELPLIIPLFSRRPMVLARLLRWSISWQISFGLEEIKTSILNDSRTGRFRNALDTLPILSWLRIPARFVRRSLSGGLEISTGLRKAAKTTSLSITPMVGLLMLCLMSKTYVNLKAVLSA